MDSRQGFRDRRRHRIGELDEGSARFHFQERIAHQLQTNQHRLGDKRQAGHHRGGGLFPVCQRLVEIVGIALNHGRLRIALTQQRAEARIELHQHQALLGNAVRDQRIGDGAGAGPKFDDRSVGMRIDVTRNRTRQHLAGGHHRAHVQRLFNPGAEKTNFVVETKRLLQRTHSGLGSHDTSNGARGRARRQISFTKGYRRKQKASRTPAMAYWRGLRRSP